MNRSGRVGRKLISCVSYTLNVKAKRRYKSDSDQASIQLKKNKLHGRMQVLEKIQPIYMPGADALKKQVKGRF